MGSSPTLRIATHTATIEGRDGGHRATRETGGENRAAREEAEEQGAALREEPVMLRGGG